MFRRRRADTGEPGETPDGAETSPGEWEDGPGETGPGTAGLACPWDAGQDVPDQERIDFGSLLVPTSEGIEVQVSVVENQPAWVTVMHGDSGLQLQAFAAPKSGGLWDEVRQEIAAEVARNGGQYAEAEQPVRGGTAGTDQPRRPGPRRPAGCAGAGPVPRGATVPAGSCAASSAGRRPAIRPGPDPWNRYSRPSSWSVAITRSRPVNCSRSGLPMKRCRHSASSRRSPRRAAGRSARSSAARRSPRPVRGHCFYLFVTRGGWLVTHGQQ